MGESGVISGDALAKRAATMPDWKVADGRISKTFLFPNFQKALDFVNRVGAVAEEEGHHPDLHLAWGRVDASTWSHDAGGITERDFALARRIDQAFFQH
jgi:4a-hydroxytetrahydrobiopterin dehydratase